MRCGPASSGSRTDGTQTATGYALLPPVDRALELLLRHARAPFDVHAARLVVELLLRPAFCPVCPGAEPAPAAGGHVGARQARGLPSLTLAGALLVDRARGDLLRLLLRRPALLE